LVSLVWRWDDERGRDNRDLVRLGVATTASAGGGPLPPGDTQLTRCKRSSLLHGLHFHHDWRAGEDTCITRWLSTLCPCTTSSLLARSRSMHASSDPLLDDSSAALELGEGLLHFLQRPRQVVQRLAPDSLGLERLDHSARSLQARNRRLQRRGRGVVGSGIEVKVDSVSAHRASGSSS
jgi:hypothetical protein